MFSVPSNFPHLLWSLFYFLFGILLGMRDFWARDAWDCVRSNLVSWPFVTPLLSPLVFVVSWSFVFWCCVCSAPAVVCFCLGVFSVRVIGLISAGLWGGGWLKVGFGGLLGVFLFLPSLFLGVAWGLREMHALWFCFYVSLWPPCWLFIPSRLCEFISHKLLGACHLSVAGFYLPCALPLDRILFFLGLLIGFYLSWAGNSCSFDRELGFSFDMCSSGGHWAIPTPPGEKSCLVFMGSSAPERWNWICPPECVASLLWFAVVSVCVRFFCCVWKGSPPGKSRWRAIVCEEATGPWANGLI